MKVLSLFSGIGGLDLAAEWAGMEIVAFCEIDPYAVKVLKRRWPNVPIFGDVATLGRDSLIEREIRPEDIDVITGGFPCQPFSVAGKRKGKDDERFLWGEFSRIIGEIRPSWIVAENVPGLISIALDDVLADLESQGYACLPFVYPASAVGAPHRRERVFIVANSYKPRLERRDSEELPKCSGKWFVGSGCASGKLWPTAHANCSNGAGKHGQGGDNLQTTAGGSLNPDWVEILMGFPPGWTDIDCAEPLEWPGWPAPLARNANWATPDCSDRRSANSKQQGTSNQVKTAVVNQHTYEPPRTIKGCPNRTKRLRCLGNAVVPQQAYPIFRAIMEVECNG